MPHSEAGHLAGDLGELWPSYAAYAVSFAIIGMIWVNHHAIFERITVVDRPLLFLSLFLLLTVAFLPFPTALLGEYVRDGDNAHVAAVVYSANMTLIALGFMALWAYLARTPALLTGGFKPADARQSLRRSAVGPVVYGLTILVAFVSPVACLAVYAALALYFAISYTVSGWPITDIR